MPSAPSTRPRVWRRGSEPVRRCAAVFSIGRLIRVKACFARAVKLCNMHTGTLMRLIVPLLLLGVETPGAAGPLRASEGNTSGWAYMTPQERLEHQATVRALTDYDACRAYQSQHHETMQARAQASGQILKPASERRDLCEHLRPQQAKP